MKATIMVALAMFATSRAFTSSRGLFPRVLIATRREMSASSESSGKSVEEWQAQLSPNEFAVLRQAATEPSGFSENTEGELEFELVKSTGSKYPKLGAYTCKGCGSMLYEAKTKFDSGCGWPAFYEGVPGAITEKPDADGRRIEIVCSKCDSHLGHTFKGVGFPTPTNERHCVNGICLNYNTDE